MLNALFDAFLFDAPEPSYDDASLVGNLCWLPRDEGRAAEPLQRGGGAGSKAGRRTPNKLPCLWFQATRLPTTIIYLHSNGEDLGLVYGTMRVLHTVLQVSVLAVEYPGYGLLKKEKASEEGCYGVARAALRYLIVDLGIQCSQVILLGRSMGSGPALHLASRFPVGGVILVNAFASVQEVARRYIGDLAARLSFGETFMNRRMIADVSSPVLLIHAADDDAVPWSHSAALFELCGARKQLVMPEKMSHNSNLFDDPSFFSLPVVRFFKLSSRKGRLPRPPPDVFVAPLPREPSLSHLLSRPLCPSCAFFAWVPNGTNGNGAGRALEDVVLVDQRSPTHTPAGAGHGLPFRFAVKHRESGDDDPDLAAVTELGEGHPATCAPTFMV